MTNDLISRSELIKKLEEKRTFYLDNNQFELALGILSAIGCVNDIKSVESYGAYEGEKLSCCQKCLSYERCVRAAKNNIMVRCIRFGKLKEELG